MNIIQKFNKYRLDFYLNYTNFFEINFIYILFNQRNVFLYCLLKDSAKRSTKSVLYIPSSSKAPMTANTFFKLVGNLNFVELDSPE